MTKLVMNHLKIKLRVFNLWQCEAITGAIQGTPREHLYQDNGIRISA